MKTPHWTTRLEVALADPTALRVLDKTSIVRLARDMRPEVSGPAVERWIQEAVSANRLQRVVRGLYLNRLINPPAQLAEAAVWLRPRAVISLQTVLGDAGIWNNFTDWVTAVVPLSRRYTTPSLGRRETAAGTFVFRGLPEAVLEAGRQEDRLVSGTTYRRATPEAALLHWLYLSKSPRSRMSEPPLDMDLAMLNVQRLRRHSRAMRLSESLEEWLTRVGDGRPVARLAPVAADKPSLFGYMKDSTRIEGDVTASVDEKWSALSGDEDHLYTRRSGRPLRKK